MQRTIAQIRRLSTNRSMTGRTDVRTPLTSVPRPAAITGIAERLRPWFRDGRWSRLGCVCFDAQPSLPQSASALGEQLDGDVLLLSHRESVAAATLRPGQLIPATHGLWCLGSVEPEDLASLSREDWQVIAARFRGVLIELSAAGLMTGNVPAMIDGGVLFVGAQVTDAHVGCLIERFLHASVPLLGAIVVE